MKFSSDKLLLSAAGGEDKLGQYIWQLKFWFSSWWFLFSSYLPNRDFKSPNHSFPGRIDISHSWTQSWSFSGADEMLTSTEPCDDSDSSSFSWGSGTTIDRIMGFFSPNCLLSLSDCRTLETSEKSTRWCSPHSNLQSALPARPLMAPSEEPIGPLHCYSAIL